MSASISLPQGQIAVSTEGSGIPLVIIAGGPGVSWTYLSPLRVLADTYRLVFFDQPGCGSSASEGSPSADQTSTATVSVIREAAGAGPFAILAHSWGAYLAARACAELEAGPIATVLMNPIPLDRARFDAAQARLLARVTPAVTKQMSRLTHEGTAEAGRELMRILMP